MKLPKALVVEDNRDIAFLLEDTLKLCRFDVSGVNTGLNAINWLEMNDAPQLILLDVNMPVLDGRSVYQYLRTKDKYNQTRVIVTTSNNIMAQRLSTELVNNDMLMPKPFQMHDLFAIAREVEAENLHRVKENSG